MTGKEIKAIVPFVNYAKGYYCRLNKKTGIQQIKRIDFSLIPDVQEFFFDSDNSNEYSSKFFSHKHTRLYLHTYGVIFSSI